MPEPYSVSDVAALLRHASMSSSYKPALLKGLVRICRSRPEHEIGLTVLGDEFAKMYWNQTVVYHLRQASSLTKESEVIKAIRAAADSNAVRIYHELPAEAKRKIGQSMARVLAINVLSAFHTSKPASMPRLYEWNKGDISVRVSDEAAAFLRTHGAALEVIANYHWAAFLEGCNRLAPRIIQKVSRDGASRGSLLPYLRILTEHERSCFYCGTEFSKERRPTVDHVIPWSFILEDALWDLVLACAPCNSSKSDTLPESVFVEKLLLYNAVRQRSQAGSRASLFPSRDEITGLYEAAISLEWPAFWTPTVV